MIVRFKLPQGLINIIS